ncbi:MAG TPA: amino acid adenylation domain-containing protein, partial [Thermoanaerobaculia bacterium]|nr:amino acid adenylation domain-containing protein [Thermoanaerobaculia bacterium]
RTGAAYLPLDPDYPEERLRFMLEDAGAPVVLVAGGTPPGLAAAVAACGAAVVDLLEAAPGAEGLPLDQPGPGPGSLAYITYTSGSTGRPKGVAVPQGAVARLVFGVDYAELGPHRRLAQASTLAFDAATFELWGALLHGGTLVGIDRDLALDPEALGAELARRRVTTIFLTTALFHQLVQAEGDLSGIDELLFGGEACDPERVRQAVARDRRGPRRVLHVYGPTESTTFASWLPVEVVPAGAATVPIGWPLANTVLQVADGGLAPVPAGVPGELLIGGAGLARGYWRRPGLTAERFVPDPLTGRPGARLYRTGDRARLDAAGRVDFLGRFDHQVKVRGFRIEPGEIEACLARHPAVAAQVVVAREDLPGERRLVAYAVPAEGASTSARELRAHLAAGLPDFMVPSAVVLLAELPLDPNGKVDRRALPAPEEAEGEARGPEGFVPPRGPFEELMAEVWAALLPGAAVGAHDDFFDLGGHSLLATRVVSRLRQLTGAELPLRRLFEHPTVAALARLLEEAVEGAAAPGEEGPRSPPPPLEPVSRDGRREEDGTVRFPASFAQERLWFLGSFGGDRAQYNVPAPVSVVGRLEAAPLARALARIVRRHEALRTVFARGETGVVQRVL